MFAKYIIDGERIIAWFPSTGSQRIPYSEENLEKVEQMVAVYNYRVKKRQKEQEKVKRDNVFIGNIYHCTEYNELVTRLSESSFGHVTYDHEVLKKKAILIKRGHYYLDIDDPETLISGETMGARYAGQIYVLEDQLEPYQAAPVFKILEVDNELYIIPSQGQLAILPNNSIVKRAINIVLGQQGTTLKDKFLEKIELLFEQLESNPIVKHNCDRMAQNQKKLVRKKENCPDAS